MTLNIGGVQIGRDNPCRFVAEMSCNANGSLPRMLRMITAAKDAGADLVKLQAYTPDELVALRGDGPAPAQWGEQGWTMRALYEKAATPFHWFPAIAEYCADLEIPWFSSVFGSESLAFLESMNCPAYKIARLDNHNRTFIDSVRDVGKPCIVSADWVKDYRPDVRREGRDFTLWCPEGYPQTALHLRPAFEKRCEVAYGGPCEWVEYDGFSYHGTDPMALVAAATLGAKLVEFHFQLQDEPSELESNISLSEYDLRLAVQHTRRIETML